MTPSVLDRVVAVTVPSDRVAPAPAEERGLARDEVRLMVARPGAISHTRFHRLGDQLRPGDLLVVNTSPTMPAALDGVWRGRPIVVHLSTRMDDGNWTIELRRFDGLGPVGDGEVGDRVDLEGDGAIVTLLAPAGPGRTDGSVRLWSARLDLPTSVLTFLAHHGRPIAYGPAVARWPLSTYQTIFARLPAPRPRSARLGPGASAEMASAARPFTPSLVTDLVGRGITIAPLTLHAGVSSLEGHEPPRPEPFEVPAATAALVATTRRAGGRVIAVGTTATRALETVADNGEIQAARGWTDLVLGPERPARIVDGIVTGWHSPDASHLLLLQAVAGPALVQRAYEAAVAGPYLWHEFGDSCLLLPT